MAGTPYWGKTTVAVTVYSGGGSAWSTPGDPIGKLPANAKVQATGNSRRAMEGNENTAFVEISSPLRGWIRADAVEVSEAPPKPAPAKGSARTNWLIAGGIALVAWLSMRGGR